MSGWTTLNNFYTSSEWRNVRRQAIERATNERGFVVDEITGHEIVKPCDIVVHHKHELTLENVNDLGVSLALDNLQVVSFQTHNFLHKRFGQVRKNVYWVWGSPFAGKLDFVKRSMAVGDLVVDTNTIWDCVDGGLGIANKPRGLTGVVFNVRNALLDAVLTRHGQWNNAWVVGAYYDEQLAKRLDAVPVLVEAVKGDCLKRAEGFGPESVEYVNRWWFAYGEPPQGTQN